MSFKLVDTEMEATTKELAECLLAAMAEWAGWTDDARGWHPSEVAPEKWARCVAALSAVGVKQVSEH